MGLLGFVITDAIFLMHDSSLTKDFPSYYYLIGLLGLFNYQTLDAVDGK